jgi:hypothetical protein
MFVATIRNGAWRIIGWYARVRGSRFRGCQHAAFQPHPCPAPEFETWLEKMGVMQGQRLQRIDDRHALVAAYLPAG